MAWERGIIIKSQTELDLMREAGRVNALALEACRRMIKPGITTLDIDDVAAETIRKHGGKPAFLGVPGAYPYPATITVSINEEMVHGIPGKRKLKEGDIVSIDCGTILDGFVGDSAFSMGVGEISDLARKLMDVTEKSLYIGIEKMHVGNRVGDVSSAVQEYVESFGFHVPREYTGHGIGRSMWEGPQLPNYGTAGRGIPLRAGMAIAIEPMVLVGTHQTRVMADQWTVSSKDGSLTAHFEHSVAITQNGPLILTIP